MGKKEGRIKYIPGVVSGKEGQVTSQVEAWREEAKCGCGIDCCNNALVLIDKATKNITYIYVENGELKTTTDKKDLKKAFNKKG